MIGILAGINIAIFLVAFSAFIVPQANLLEKLSSLPTAWGAFLGSVVGLCGVAWTTNQGFKNLIRAQAHRAKIEEKGREHQREISIAVSEKEKQDRSKIIPSAIMAEFNTLLIDIQNLNTTIDMQIKLLSVVGSNPPDSMLRIQPKTWHLPIWDKLVSEIGVLKPSLASDVFAIYARTRYKPTGESAEFPNQMIAIEVYGHMKDENQKWIEDLLHVNSRLSALVSGDKDPGALFYSPHRLAERKAKGWDF